METPQLPEMLFRMCLAMFTGALIGVDRELAGKPAGLRTHMMVALGSAAFALAGIYVMEQSRTPQSSEIDPTRVLQGIVGGIGFLGAGTIIQSRGSVEGITTASSIWVIGAVGAAWGMGYYPLASATTLGAMFILVGMGIFEYRIQGYIRRRRERANPSEMPEIPPPATDEPIERPLRKRIPPPN